MSRRENKPGKDSPSPLLRSKSSKSKPIKELPKTSDTSDQLLLGPLFDPTFLRYGRTGRRNTLPTLYPDEEDAASEVADKQKSQQEREKQARDNLPFLDSFIKKKNKLRQSFHGSLSTSSNKLSLKHSASVKNKSPLAGSPGSASCEASPYLKRSDSPARFKRKDNQASLESSKSYPSSPNEEDANFSRSTPDGPDSSGSGEMTIGATMEGLARQALLAASVFHLIPVDKARERNYLHGRIATMSLLGPLELEKVLPHREISIFVATWNMNGQAPPHELNDLLLPADLEHVPDILAVATQESHPERFEWEVMLQETVGPSHVLFHSAVLGTLHLCILIRRDLLWFCSVPEEASVSTRPAAAFRTKGAVAVGFLLFGTSLLFICSHLTAHADKVKERVHDARRIIGSLELPKALPLRHRSKDATQNYDCVFWCGDLNFRLDQTREDVINWATCEQAFPADGPLILDGDQLKQVMAEGAAFHDFIEGPIVFPPTYKYDPGTDNFDSSSKRRTPAYTDRILFRSRISDDLKCENYSSAHQVMTSDHKPVWGLYRTKLRPGKDTIPLAAGQFNREVYLEGIKRRAAAMDRRQGLSTVCSLQ